MTASSYEIPFECPSHNFALCWQAAGRHLSRKGDGTINWLKADLTPPFLEHLSFRIGNQLFYVQLMDVDGHLDAPGNSDGLRSVAGGCNGHACVMPMRYVEGEWLVVEPDWGLISANTNEPINPPELVSSEDIKMSDWELQDFAVQVVRNHILENADAKILSSQSNPAVYPSIWFEHKNGPEWVVVRMKTYANQQSTDGPSLETVAAECNHMGQIGSVADVTFINAKQSQKDNSPALPLLRGHPAEIKFSGLKEVTQ
jgi:hypothetical protein